MRSPFRVYATARRASSRRMSTRVISPPCLLRPLLYSDAGFNRCSAAIRRSAVQDLSGFVYLGKGREAVGLTEDGRREYIVDVNPCVQTDTLQALWLWELTTAPLACINRLNLNVRLRSTSFAKRWWLRSGASLTGGFAGTLRAQRSNDRLKLSETCGLSEWEL